MKKNFYIKNVFKVFKDTITEKSYEQKLSSYNQNYSVIKGTVKDKLSNPIQNAVIKIMSINYEPLLYTSTDQNGNYEFNNIIPNEIYNMFSIAKGMQLKQKEKFLIKENETFNVDFILEVDISANLGIIIGNLVDKSTGNYINNATIELNGKSQENKFIQATSYVNESGRYVFTEIPKGNYNLKINSLGYDQETLNLSINETSQILSIKNQLISNVDNFLGTISGLITNKYNIPISRADVILYRIESDNTLIPIDFTKTNESGIYLFINIPMGNYKVESNLIERITVKSN